MSRMVRAQPQTVTVLSAKGRLIGKKLRPSSGLFHAWFDPILIRRKLPPKVLFFCILQVSLSSPP